MFSGLRKKARAYNHIRIHADRLKHNYNVLTQRAGEKQVGVVLKSNAYGHGIVQLIPICNELDVPMVLVDSLYEALICKDAGVQAPVLVMGITAAENLAQKTYPFHFAASDKKSLEDLAEHQPHAPIHLFMNTGMNREGFDMDEVDWIIEFVKVRPELNVVGLMSHFAEGDVKPQSELTTLQNQRFEEVHQRFVDAGFNFEYVHIDAAPSFVGKVKTIGNLIRMGKAFYGVADTPEDYQARYQDLLPALELVSTIVTLKNVKAGEMIGYGHAYQAQNDMTVALIPAGYQEGVERRLSNKGVMMVRGVECPIVGRVSMNYTSIDVTAVSGVQVGDEVEVFSVNPEQKNSLINVSELCETIPHEMMVRMDYTVRREVV